LSVDASQLLAPRDCPAVLRSWADTLVGAPIGESGSKRGVRVIAGWRWDGLSDDVIVLIAPCGEGTRAMPEHVRRALHGGGR
jgi:hypothetical protein